MFRDARTPSPYVETFLYNGPGEGASSAKPDHVYLDAMGFGMGCCCLQVVLLSLVALCLIALMCTQMTFQGRSIEEARYLYDQMAVMTPIVLALSGVSPSPLSALSSADVRVYTAATPILRGTLVDHDCRWAIISGEQPL